MKKNSFHLLMILVSLGLICLANACVGHNGSLAEKTSITEASGLHTDGQAIIIFDTLEHDFGTMIEGEMVVCYFTYRNSGTAELLITSVEATCGCTTPDWSREPLPASESGVLKVMFDASGRSGAQRKKIRVRSNAEPAEVSLSIKANVKEN